MLSIRAYIVVGLITVFVVVSILRIVYARHVFDGVKKFFPDFLDKKIKKTAFFYKPDTQFIFFVLQGKYNNISDKTLKSKCAKLRIYTWINILMFVLCLVSVFIYNG